MTTDDHLDLIVARLANELDMRIGQLTAIENHLLGLEE
jgi:hypothetical protein